MSGSAYAEAKASRPNASRKSQPFNELQGTKLPQPTQDLMEFAAALPARVAARPPDTALLSDLYQRVSSLRHDTNAFQKLDSGALDKQGTSLWNLCVQLKRDVEAGDARLECSLRVFAFQLLDRRQRPTQSTTNQNTRLLRIVNKLARCLLQNNLFLGPTDLCGWVFERAADYVHALGEKANAIGHDELLSHQSLSIEHRLQRVTLCWKQNRLDIARSMYCQLTAAEFQRDPILAEKSADLCFEIGKDLLQRKEGYQAVKWLESSFDAITSHDLVELGQYATELRLSILQYLIRALIGLGDGKSLEKSTELVALLEQDYAGKIAIPLLKMDIINAQPEFNAAAYNAELQRILRTILMTETHFKTFIARVLALKDHSPSLACTALDSLLSILFKGDGETEWVERTIVTRIWISVEKLSEQVGVHHSILQMFDQYHLETNTSMTAAASYAVQVLLWKKIDELMEKESHQDALEWCQLALHVALSNAGDVSAAKIRRKAMMCSIYLSNTFAARAQFDQMTEAAKANLLTQYLMYKVAVLDNDVGVASTCLEAVARHPSKDATILYACVLEAQNSGNRELAVVALQKVLQQYDYNAPRGVHLPALIRCTAKLLMSELAEGHQNGRDVVAELVALFQGALESTKKQTSSNQAFDQKELEWFCRTMYNLSLRYYDKLDPVQVIALLETCIGFMQQCKDEQSPGSLLERSRTCHVFVSQLLVQSARADSQISQQRQLYLRVHGHAAEYWRQKTPLGAAHFEEDTDVATLHRKMLLFDFEACKFLGLWDQMQSIILQIKPLQETTGLSPRAVRSTLDALADMVLGSEAPKTVMSDTLSTIIDCSSASPLSPPRLARWIRILYQLSLKQPTPCNSAANTSTQAVVDRACFAIDAAASTADPYPNEEVEWLVTTIFNAAVDAYCASDKVQCLSMGEMALNLVQRVTDGGKLKKSVKERLGRMVWDG